MEKIVEKYDKQIKNYDENKEREINNLIEKYNENRTKETKEY